MAHRLNNKREPESGTFLLFHGTNRKYDNHETKKNRTVLNDSYQGDWICYTEDEDVAWKYSSAARNQNFDKELFLKDVDIFLSNSKHDDVVPHIKSLLNNLMDLGFDKGWEKTFTDYARKTRIQKDDSSFMFFQGVNRIQKEKNFDINDLTGVLDYVDGSKSSLDEDPEDSLHMMFNQSVNTIPKCEIDMLESWGFTHSIPEERVIKSIITAKNILRTNNKEEAKKGRENGFDLVIYNGENTVDGKKEFLIKEPSQITFQSITAKKIKHEEIEIGEYLTTEEKIKVNFSSRQKLR